MPLRKMQAPVKRQFSFNVNPDIKGAFGRPVYVQSCDFTPYEKECEEWRKNAKEGIKGDRPVHPVDTLRERILAAFPSGQKAGDYHIAYKGKACKLKTGTDAKLGIVYAYIESYKRLDWAPLAVQQALWKDG